MFNGCENLKEIDVSKFNTDKATTMQAMFYNCLSVTKLDVTGFNTENVTNMSNMFSYCNSLSELDVSGFKTGLVTTMSNMFNGCLYLPEINLSNFDTSSLTNMTGMFTGCSCDIDFSNKNTDNVTTTFALFNVFYGTSIDMSGCSLKNSKDNRNFVSVADNLIHFKAPRDISYSMYIMAENLSVESLMSIINNLADVKNTQTLEIGEHNISKLTEDDLAIAIGKNWTVC
jgi:surface protein